MKQDKLNVQSKLNSPYIPVLMEKLSPSLQFKKHTAGTRLFYSNNNTSNLYFIRDGMVSVYKQPDDILFGMFVGPTIRGLLHSVDDTTDSVYIKVMTTAEIAIVSAEDFNGLLTEHNLWEMYAKHLQFVMLSLSKHLIKILPASSFEVIRSQLYELIAEPEQIRSSITAEAYIRSRTKLSRSNILKILAELKTGGYIDIHRGFLKGINFIPERF